MEKLKLLDIKGSMLAKYMKANNVGFIPRQGRVMDIRSGRKIRIRLYVDAKVYKEDGVYVISTKYGDMRLVSNSYDRESVWLSLASKDPDNSCIDVDLNFNIYFNRCVFPQVIYLLGVKFVFFFEDVSIENVV